MSRKKFKRTLHFNKRNSGEKPAKQLAFTTTVCQGRDGKVHIPLPAEVKRLLRLKPSQRVWITGGKAKVTVSTQPWGPYPVGRRNTARLIRSNSWNQNGGV